MRRLFDKRFRASGAVVLCLCPGYAVAGTLTATTNIRAMVSGSGTCSIGGVQNTSMASTTGALALSDQTADATLVVSCTDGATPFILYSPTNNSFSNNSRRMKSTTDVQYISYNIYTDAARTQIWPATQDAGLNGIGTSTTYHMYPKVPAQYATVAGSYTDTISFQIIF